MKLSRRLRSLVKKHSLRTTFKIAALLTLATVPAVTRAAQFTYTPPATPDATNWSQGTAGHFNAVPVSAATTEVTFGLNVTTALAAGTYTSNNDLIGTGTNGGFLLNILDLNGLGAAAAGTPATINITGTALEFATNGALAPVVNLNGLKGTGGLVYNVATNLALDNNTTFTGNGTATFNFAGVLSGAGTVTKNGSSTLTLTGANTYTGATTVNTGIVALSGANGSLALSASPITINGGEFQFNNTVAGGGVNTNRVADTQAVVLGGGLLDFLGANDATNATETIGAVTAGAGAIQSTIAVQPQTGGTGANTLTLASLTHTAGQGVILVDGVGLGSAAPGAGLGNLFATTAPTLVGTTAAGVGINSAVKNTSIVPFLVGEVTGTGTGTLGGVGAANTFVTYNATTGFRPLNPTDEFTLNAIAAGNNTYITAATAATTGAAINSLVINGGNLTVTTGQTITDTSGALLFASSNNIVGTTTTAATLAFGSAEALITVNSGVSANVSSGTGVLNLSGTGGLTKSGAGTLTFNTPTSVNVNQALTGAININQGTLNANATGGLVFPAADVITVASGATMEFQNHAGGVNTTIANPYVLSGFGAGGTGAIFTYNSGAFNFTGSFSLASDTGIRTDAEGQSTFVPATGVLGNPIGINGVISSPNGVTSGLTLYAASAGAGVPNFSLAGANTYTGSTVLTSSGNGTSGIPFLVQLTGGTNRLPSTTNLIFGGNPTGVTGTFNSNVTLLLNGVAQTVASVTTAGTGTYAIAGGNATASAFTVNNAAADTYAGTIGGTGFNNNNISLTKTGAGTLTLSGVNTYTGATTVSTGVLALTNAGAIAAGSAVTVASGATLQMIAASGATFTTAAFPLTLNGNGTTYNLEFPTNNSATYNVGSPITLNNGAIIRAFGLINTYNFNGAIGGTATTNGLVFRAEGANTAGQPHTFGLNAASTYTGNTTLTAVSQQGIIKLGIANALPVTTTLSLLGGTSVNSPASLELNGFSQTLAGLTTTNGTGGTRVTNASATLSTLTVNNAATDFISGILGGTTAGTSNFAFSKTGGGAVVLSGANTYTGGTTIAGSFIQMSGAGTLGATTNNLTINTAGALDLNGVSQTVNALSGTATGLAISSGATGTTQLTVGNGGGTGSFGGTIADHSAVFTGSPVVAITKTGAGTQTFTGPNTYSGGTTVSGGTLALGDGGTFGTGAVTNNATVGFSNSNPLSVGNAISGTGAVVQSGAGTTTLTGANTFGGTTTISAGTLAASATTGQALGGTTGIAINAGTLSLGTANQVNTTAPISMGVGGATPTSGILSVAAGANQGTANSSTGGTVTPATVGTGTITTGGTPGAGTNAVGLGALTLNSTATLLFTSSPATLVFSGFTPNSNVLTISGFVSTTTATAGSSGIDGTDDRLVFNGDQAANLANFNFGQGAGIGVSEVALGGGFFEVYGAVPEPSTWVGGLLGLGVIGITQRRRMGGLLGVSRQS